MGPPTDNCRGLIRTVIIEAILAGECDPRRLARLGHERCRRTEAEIARALHGNWREEHLFALKQALELYQGWSGPGRRSGGWPCCTAWPTASAS